MLLNLFSPGTFLVATTWSRVTLFVVSEISLTKVAAGVLIIQKNKQIQLQLVLDYLSRNVGPKAHNLLEHELYGIFEGSVNGSDNNFRPKFIHLSTFR